MKVQEIKIKKFKKLENVDQQIKGQHILLLGENGVGKTSVLQFLEIAVGNQKKLPPGITGSGEIVVDKGGNLLTISVSFREGKPVVKVKGNGIFIDNNKSAIAELFGAVGFDIEEFAALSKTDAGRKKQVEIYKSKLSPEMREGLARFEANLKNHEEERTELGRDIKKLEGAIALHPLKNLIPPDLKKITGSDPAELMSQLRLVQAANQKVTNIENGIVNFKKEMGRNNERVAELQAEINRLNGETEALDKKVKDGQKWLATHQHQDTSVLEKAIEDSTAQNERFNQAQQLLKDQEKLAELKNNYGEATALIETTREAIANAIKDEPGPIPGLAYTDDYLTYNGVPVHPDTLSKSEIMEIGFRWKLAENPDMFMCIPEAESLGAERFLLIKEIADKHNVQIFGEQVQRGKKELVFEIMTEELIGA